jgi:integrase
MAQHESTMYPPGVYARSGTKFLWVVYWHRGIPYRRSAKTADPKKAAEARERLITEVRGETYISPKEERLTLTALLDAYLTARDLEKGAPGRDVACVVGRLKALIGTWRAVDVTKPKLQAWAKMLRDQQRYAPGTVRKYLRYLRAAYASAREARLVSSLPPFPTILVRNTRKGFFSEPEFQVFIDALAPRPYGEMLVDIVVFGFYSGWRKREILELPWTYVNHEARCILLPATGTSKRPEDRELALDYRLENGAWANHPLWQLIERRWKARVVGTSLSPWVFHRDGRPVVELDGAWVSACREVGFWRVDDPCPRCAKARRPRCAGHPTKTMHDLRRSRVRIFETHRIPREVGKTFTGHRTDRIYGLYHPTVVDDQRDALRVLDRGPAPKIIVPAGLVRTTGAHSSRAARYSSRTVGEKVANLAEK